MMTSANAPQYTIADDVFTTSQWVVVTPDFTYGPFRTEQQASAVPVARLPFALTRLMTEADLIAIDAQDDELDQDELGQGGA